MLSMAVVWGRPGLSASMTAMGGLLARASAGPMPGGACMVRTWMEWNVSLRCVCALMAASLAANLDPRLPNQLSRREKLPRRMHAYMSPRGGGPDSPPP